MINGGSRGGGWHNTSLYLFAFRSRVRKYLLIIIIIIMANGRETACVAKLTVDKLNYIGLHCLGNLAVLFYIIIITRGERGPHLFKVWLLEKNGYIVVSEKCLTAS